MNEVFLIGTIEKDVKFDFIINSNNYISIAELKIKTLDKQEVNIVAYNDLADFCYRCLEIDNDVIINGKIKQNCVEMKQIKIIFSQVK